MMAFTVNDVAVLFEPENEAYRQAFSALACELDDLQEQLERSSPEYRAARSRLKNEYRARQEEEQRTAQSEAYKTIRENTSLDELDRRSIDEQAVSLARRDLAANRIAASELGKTIERYAAELSEKRKSEKATSSMFNAVLRGTL